MLILDGREQKINNWPRFLVVIDGDEVWLSYRLYRLLSQLALGRTAIWKGWVPFETLALSLKDRLMQVKYRLVQETGLPIIPSGFGGYRLDLKPSDIQFREGAKERAREWLGLQ